MSFRRMRFFICAGLLSSEPRGRLSMGLSCDAWARRTRIRTVATPLSFAPFRSSSPAGEGETRVPPLGSRGSGDLEAAVHDRGVRVADEAVAPLPQPQHEALRPGEWHARQHSVETRPGQMEVVNRRAVADHEAVRRPCLQLRDLLALDCQPDRETGADRSVDGLRGGGRAAARRSERCGCDRGRVARIACA